MKIITASDSSLLVEFGDVISPALNARVLALFCALMAEKDARIRNLHPAYASLLIDFDPLRMSHQELTGRVEKLAEGAQDGAGVAARTVTIPVCYGAEFGPDLGDVAAHNSISMEDVVRLHTAATYTVYFLGFSPGFAYLGGLPAQLRTPRLATPRVRVIAGSVGIAGEQTGVYPVETAGGWRLIGRTPLSMFKATSGSPSLLQPGDVVRFKAIHRTEFEAVFESA